jgi:hypothetical protein
MSCVTEPRSADADPPDPRRGAAAWDIEPPDKDAMGKPLPRWLAPAVTALLADFQHPTPIELRVGFSVGDNGADWLWLEEPGDPGPFGCEIVPDMRGELLILDLARVLQEQFFLETGQAWGQPRPPCPGHPHPADPALHDAQPWWVCPRDGHPVAPIGRLAAVLG